MFIAALFTISKKWKQPKYPSTDEWISNMCYIHTEKITQQSKRNEVLIFAKTWMLNSLTTDEP